MSDTDAAPTERLVLIDGAKAEDARKLIATWSLIGERLSSGRFGEAEFSHEAMVEEWERVSMVDRSDIERWEPVLFENGILGPDGYVDPNALTFVRSYVGDSLRKRSPKKDANG